MLALLAVSGGDGADAGIIIVQPPVFFTVPVEVNTMADELTAPNGLCSLREAIMTVNSGDTGGCTYVHNQLGDFVIQFNIPTGGSTPVILLGSELPALTKTVMINGN